MKESAALPLRHVLRCRTVSSSVQLARRTAETTYATWGVGPGHLVLGPSLLVLSELVTNSVRHAASLSPELTVVYAVGGGVLAFAVHDRHPGHPDLRGDTGGLGMVTEVVTELAGTAVVRRDSDGGGKAVWITLPL